MESVSIMPASLADRIPLPDEALTARMLAKAREGFDRKIVVLDDDPTGVQTVHDLPVYTDWRRETLESGLTEEGTMFFVLTNSRGFSQQETEHAHRERAFSAGKPWRFHPAGPLSAGDGDPSADAGGALVRPL